MNAQPTGVASLLAMAGVSAWCHTVTPTRIDGVTMAAATWPAPGALSHNRTSVIVVARARLSRSSSPWARVAWPVPFG